jgi:hypothetical protein
MGGYERDDRVSFIGWSWKDFSGLRSNLAVDRTVWGLNPGRGKVFFSSHKHPDRPWVSRGLQLNGCRRPFPGIKRPECDADHSTSCTEVENEWSYTSTPLDASMAGQGQFCIILPLTRFGQPPSRVSGGYRSLFTWVSVVGAWIRRLASV